MRKFWMGLAALTLAVSVHATENNKVKIKVTGDRVSLRAAPELNSVLLDRAMDGDWFTLIDDSNPEWFGVVPPDPVDVWVHSEFIEDEKVIPSRLNVRSGPSLNHSVLGVVHKDDAVTVRGEAGGWLRIAPPEGTVVWINRQYAEIIGAKKRPVVVITSNSAPNPEFDKVMSSVAGIAELSETLSPDPEKVQGQEITLSGVLRPTSGLLYKLVNPDVEELSICYVRGNTRQMKKLDGQELTIMGRAYWALDLDQPFVVPVKIRLSR